MESKINYNNINEVLNNIPDNFKILEETIDIEVQKEYYEASTSIEIEHEKEDPISLIEKLNLPDTNLQTKKTTLQKLAIIDSVESFRAIENFCKSANADIKDWAVLALQQSRMVLHSSLLDEQQIFISTGLGGKNNKLRYFMIFPYKNFEILNNIQKSSLEKELLYFLERNNSEFEEITFYNRFATATSLIPLKAPVTEIIGETIEECNQLGDFLSDDVIITNIKKFNENEIIEIIANHEQQA